MMQHLACIMDGNRRWARKHGLLQVGPEGVEAAYRVVQWCIQKKIPYLSLFAFSLENFKRAPHEITPLFSLMAREIERRTHDLVERRIRVRFIGDRSCIPASVAQSCSSLEEATTQGDVLHVQILFCYGARQELRFVIQNIAKAVVQGQYSADAIDDSLIAKNLWTKGVPDPDLIIRTGGVQRLSNFLLYQAAYSELYFLSCLWPDITPAHLQEAVTFYKQCTRNFGQ
jgi:undecaprenyl diphosphate synthase